MQHYAREERVKNIIAFVGGDFDGQSEFVVGRVAEMTDLRQLYAWVRAKMVADLTPAPQFA